MHNTFFKGEAKKAEAGERRKNAVKGGKKYSRTDKNLHASPSLLRAFLKF